MSQYQRILVPVDGTAPSAAGVDEAIRLASTTGGTVRLLHMLDAAAHANGFETGAVYCTEMQPAMRRAAERLLDETRARVTRAGLVAEALVVEVIADRLTEVVLADADRWGADVIVIGSHGRRGLDRICLGSEAEAVARQSRVPVLVVHEHGGSGKPSGPEAAESRGTRTPAAPTKID